MLFRIKERVKQTIGKRYSLSMEEVIAELNPALRGWDNYHNKARVASRCIRKLNGFIRERIRIFLKREVQRPSEWHTESLRQFTCSTWFMPVRLIDVLQRQRLLINSQRRSSESHNGKNLTYNLTRRLRKKRFVQSPTLKFYSTD